MDIHIEAPGYKKERSGLDFYRNKLIEKYGKYDFVKSANVKVTYEDDENATIALKFLLEKGPSLFVSAIDIVETRAFNSAIKKMNVQVEKYKEKHYHNPHRVNKPSVDNF